jgi:putative ABC transport system permease protein
MIGLWLRLAFRWRRTELDRELAEEMEFHRTMKLQEHGEAGLDAEAAAALVRREMGNLTLAQEESRDLWSFLALERLWHDVRYALRMFARNPGFTVIAALSLALGIGGNAAVFSFVNELLLRPLPYPEPERLIRITEVYPRAAFAYFREQSRSLEVASVSLGAEFNLTGEGEAMRLYGSAVSANLFSVLRAPAARGRAFEINEDQPGCDAVVILSHSLWKSKFAGDAGIVGRMIALDGIGRRVIGVMPPGFSYPSGAVQFWIPARFDPTVMEDSWGSEFTPLIARLRPGANLAQARNEIPALVSQIRKMFPFPMPRDWNAGATAIPLQEDVAGNVRGKLLVLLSSVGIVLLIACANVASLLLSRATARRKEIALRVALGAGRARILRQLLTESVLLAAIGGGLGVVLGSFAVSVFRSVLPPDLPGMADVRIDLHVLGFVAGLAVATGLAFGIAPALSTAQIDLSRTIKAGSQRSSGQGWTRVRNWLIAGELALTVVLVVAAGLLVKTLYNLSQVNPGFRPEQILTIRITPNQSLCKERAACVALYGELARRARAVPGVSDVALANTLPMDGKFAVSAIPVDVEGHPKSADFPSPMFLAGAVTPDYLRMMRIPLLAGRGLSAADGADSEGVVLISAATAKRFWPGEEAIGKHIKPAWDRKWRAVVGVTGDVRQYDLTNRAPSWISGAIYMPYAQSVQGDRQAPAAMNLLVRTASDPLRVGMELRRLAADLSPNVPIGEAQTLEGIVSASVASRRSTMGLFLSFALTAMVLAAVGIYGLVSYTVSQRTYEIGVRMAIGATKGNVVALVLGQSLRVAAAGIAAGVVAAMLATRFLAGLLYGVAANDPLTFAGVGGLLLATTAAASLAPAWRAARIDPTRSLRLE